MAALTVRAPGSPLQPADGSPFNLPMASLDGKPGLASLFAQDIHVCSLLSFLSEVALA